MARVLPKLPPGEVAVLHKRDGPLLVVSTMSESGFGLAAFDDRSPAVMMRAGCEPLHQTFTLLHKSRHFCP